MSVSRLLFLKRLLTCISNQKSISNLGDNYKSELLRNSATSGHGWCGSVVVNQSVAGLNPSQGTYLGCGSGPLQGGHKRQPHTVVSLPHFLPPFPSLKNK